MESILQDFLKFLSEFQLSVTAIEKSKQFLQDVMPFYFQCGHKVSKKALFACCAFIANQNNDNQHTVDEESSALPEVTVSKLLEKAEISIMDFISVTCLLKKNYPLSENAKQNLIALERKYLIVSALYDKFESMTAEIFYSEVNVSPPVLTDRSNETGRLVRDHKVLCWLLFLVAKAKVLWHRQELLATFNLLLCCVGEVIKTTPHFLLLPPFDEAVAKNKSLHCILEILSCHFQTKFEEVKAVYDGWLHVATELKVDAKLPKIQKLQSIYMELYLQNGDFDESLFLYKDWHLLPASSGQNINSPQKYTSASVRRTLDTAEALNTILLTAPDELTDELKSCLHSVTNGAQIIEDFIADAKVTFVEAYINAQEGSSKNLAERRFQLASRYYFLMLHGLLKKELGRLNSGEFSSFIRNIVFHKSLLVCCLEVTLMSCGSVSAVNFTPVPYGGSCRAQGIAFPWILTVFDLEPFNFFKIIESFIRGAPTITMQIINHLKSIEDKVLDSLAWKSGSPVFRSLSGGGCSPCCKIKLTSTEPSSRFLSPNKDTFQQSPVTPHTCHAINLFLNKVCRLAYQRLEKLSVWLKIEKDTVSDIWTAIEQVLYKKTNLLLDRHVDQIIMCCIFAVCKAKSQEIRFKTILSFYDNFPHSSTSIYKQVLSGGKKEFIHHFYNKEFHTEMRSFILGLCEKEGAAPSPSTTVPPSPVVLSPFYSLPHRKNIFVSPLQKSPFKNPNEIIHRTMPSYTFGDLSQSSEKLKTINSSLYEKSLAKEKMEARNKKRLLLDSAEKIAVKSARKFLRFDEPDGSK